LPDGYNENSTLEGFEPREDVYRLHKLLASSFDFCRALHEEASLLPQFQEVSQGVFHEFDEPNELLVLQPNPES
jgi:hypothetical protein